MQVFLTVTGVVVVLLAGLVLWIYQGFANRRSALQQAFSALDVQLKRRWELIPSLVQTVQEYAQTERRSLERVIHARNAARDARGTSRERFSQEARVSAGLAHLFEVAGRQSEIESNEQFVQLRRQLREVEELIESATGPYHEAVRHWHEEAEKAPARYFARRFGFEPAERFEPAGSWDGSGAERIAS